MSRRAAAEIKQKDLGGALCMALSGHDLLVAPVWLAGNLVLLAGMAAARLFRVRTAAPRRLAARRRFAAWQTIGSPSLARSRHFPRIRKIRKNPLTVAPSPVGIILASTDSNLAFRRVVYSPFVRTCRQGWLRSGVPTLEVEAMGSFERRALAAACWPTLFGSGAASAFRPCTASRRAAWTELAGRRAEPKAPVVARFHNRWSSTDAPRAATAPPGLARSLPRR